MSSTEHPSDAATLKLLERLILSRLDNVGPKPRVTIGSAPADWDVPIPSDAVVVGSLERSEFDRQLVLDVAGTPESAVEAISQTLINAGWRPPPQSASDRSGGFVGQREHTAIARRLCDDRTIRYVTIVGTPSVGGVADVRIHLNSDPMSFVSCGEPSRSHSPLSVFPLLSTPSDMSLQGTGGGGGNGSAHIDARLSGSLTPDRIEQHYRKQLLAIGWRLGEHSSTEQWAWSTWRFNVGPGVSWTALLTASHPDPLDDDRHVHLIATGRSPRSRGVVITTDA